MEVPVEQLRVMHGMSLVQDTFTLKTKPSRSSLTSVVERTICPWQLGPCLLARKLATGNRWGTIVLTAQGAGHASALHITSHRQKPGILQISRFCICLLWFFSLATVDCIQPEKELRWKVQVDTVDDTSLAWLNTYHATIFLAVWVSKVMQECDHQQ